MMMRLTRLQVCNGQAGDHENQWCSFSCHGQAMQSTFQTEGLTHEFSVGLIDYPSGISVSTWVYFCCPGVSLGLAFVPPHSDNLSCCPPQIFKQIAYELPFRLSVLQRPACCLTYILPVAAKACCQGPDTSLSNHLTLTTAWAVVQGKRKGSWTAMMSKI